MQSKKRYINESFSFPNENLYTSIDVSKTAFTHSNKCTDHFLLTYAIYRGVLILRYALTKCLRTLNKRAFFVEVARHWRSPPFLRSDKQEKVYYMEIHIYEVCRYIYFAANYHTPCPFNFPTMLNFQETRLTLAHIPQIYY